MTRQFSPATLPQDGHAVNLQVWSSSDLTLARSKCRDKGSNNVQAVMNFTPIGEVASRSCKKSVPSRQLGPKVGRAHKVR